MTAISIAGAGAFGTALAIALAKGGKPVTLLARDKGAAKTMQTSRTNTRYLADIPFPETLTVTADANALAVSNVVLVAVPTQHLRGFLAAQTSQLANKTCVLCCKGIEKSTGLLPSQVTQDVLPNARSAILTGPGFASEIARGLPTALTLATTTDNSLQAQLSTDTIRLYLSNDPVGAQLGGALKNVIAIACGIAIGAGLGESARAALMTRGYAEMLRLAVDLGGQPATLSGLSGLGDLALTCTSLQSRNFSLGYTLGQGGAMAKGTTFEGVATARATMVLAARRGIDMPLSRIVTAVLERALTIPQAVDALLSRPLKSE
ncbi:MAG: NAD(P)-dependent glycerol-3-phosphate dehydrogenase [Alphaproteobacteria bacterium]|nr:NAD(P)-dependent glycerol-3-phosphate dehydrogenase [Alphaproteobacteria bacterium]